MRSRVNRNELRKRIFVELNSSGDVFGSSLIAACSISTSGLLVATSGFVDSPSGFVDPISGFVGGLDGVDPNEFWSFDKSQYCCFSFFGHPIGQYCFGSKFQEQFSTLSSSLSFLSDFLLRLGPRVGSGPELGRPDWGTGERKSASVGSVSDSYG